MDSNMQNEESIIEFKNEARRVFKFLVSEYGYRELSPPDQANPCSVTFINKANRIRVVAEGISWGSIARISFGHLRADKFQDYDLLDLSKALKFDGLELQKATESDQYVQLEIYSKLLQKIGTDVLKGNLDISGKLDEIQENRARKWNEQN